LCGAGTPARVNFHQTVLINGAAADSIIVSDQSKAFGAGRAANDAIGWEPLCHSMWYFRYFALAVQIAV
jgi:hypothetical protein